MLLFCNELKCDNDACANSMLQECIRDDTVKIEHVNHTNVSRETFINKYLTINQNYDIIN